MPFCMFRLTCLRILISRAYANEPPFVSIIARPFLNTLTHSLFLRSPNLIRLELIELDVERETFNFSLGFSFGSQHIILQWYLLQPFSLLFRVLFRNLMWNFVPFYVVWETNTWKLSSIHLELWCSTTWSTLNSPIFVEIRSQTETGFDEDKLISKLFDSVWTAIGLSLYDFVFFHKAQRIFEYFTIFHWTDDHRSITCQNVYTVHM